MTGARRVLAVGALAACAVAAPIAAAGPLAGGDPSVVVRDRDGDTVARVELPADGRFAVAYRHSYYRAAAQERFVRVSGGFRLEAVASPRAAVLDYYAIDGRRTREGAWHALRPRHPPRYRRLALVATAVGRRTLVVGDRRIALYGPRPRHVTLTVEER